MTLNRLHCGHQQRTSIYGLVCFPLPYIAIVSPLPFEMGLLTPQRRAETNRHNGELLGFNAMCSRWCPAVLGLDVLSHLYHTPQLSSGCIKGARVRLRDIRSRTEGWPSIVRPTGVILESCGSTGLDLHNSTNSHKPPSLETESM